MSTEIQDQTPPAEAPPIEAPVETPAADAAPVEAPLAIDDDAAVDAVLAEQTITLPDGDALTQASQVGQVARAYRSQIKALKEELTALKPNADRASQLETQIATLTSQVQQLQPYVQAYQAMTQAATQAAQPQEEDVPAPEAEKWARRYDLYKPDGALDLDRARDIVRDFRATARAEAERVTEQRVAPLQARSVQQSSAYMLARAKNTTLPNGAKADPQILDMVWRQLDPALTATPEGAKQALVAALGYSQLSPAQTAGPVAPVAPRGPNGQFQAQAPAQTPPGDPMFTERAGGRDTPAAQPLSDKERQYLKDVGMTEKEYFDTVKSAPWMRR